jgi:hypothetical protein
MTLSDFVWLAIGETLLAGTFALGILVGVSLNRKGQRNGYGNAGTENEWNHAGPRRVQKGSEDSRNGCCQEGKQ